MYPNNLSWIVRNQISVSNQSVTVDVLQWWIVKYLCSWNNDFTIQAPRWYKWIILMDVQSGSTNVINHTVSWSIKEWINYIQFFSDENEDIYCSVVSELSGAKRWSITGTLSDQTDLQNTLDIKANNESSSSVSTTVTLLNDTTHWTYSSPLTGDINIDTVWAVRWVVIDMYHQQATVPTFTWWIVRAWTYSTVLVNNIQIKYDWIQAHIYITPMNA